MNCELQQRLGDYLVFVTLTTRKKPSNERLIFVMNDGEIVQSGTLVDIYDEPINHFVADFH